MKRMPPGSFSAQTEIIKMMHFFEFVENENVLFSGARTGQNLTKVK